MPGYLYRSPSVYALERDRLFMKDWLCVARVDELPNPGDYLALHVAREPIIVARNRSGALRAFSNMCAHRGAEIATGAGNVTRFSCPYHGWSYDLDGRLTGAAYMNHAADFAKDECRLPPLKLEVRDDWIYVSFDENAESLERTAPDISRDLGVSGATRYRLADKFELTFDCNWKLLVEKLIASMLQAPSRSMSRARIAVRGHGGLSVLSAKEATTGAPAGDDAQASPTDDFTAFAFMPPNLCALARADHLQYFVCWPTAAERSRLLVYLLVPADADSGPAAAERWQRQRDRVRERLAADAPTGHRASVALDAALWHSFQHYAARTFAPT